MRSNYTYVLGGCVLLALPQLSFAEKSKAPNVIIIFADDQGYQDLGCYGSPLIKTPHIDKMASEGVRFTEFYVSGSVSSASRAGLLTGRLNTRNGAPGVFWPNDAGLPLSQITIAQALKDYGYSTACFGKWHLGDLPGHRATDRGFDKYLGIPYSNDMWISPSQGFAPDVKFREGKTLEQAKADQQLIASRTRVENIKSEYRAVPPLVEGIDVVEYPCDQATTTRRYFDAAIDFMDEAKDNPFFIYITPAMPHWPLFASEDFAGTSARGTFGDVIQEIDWNVGRLLDELKARGLDENTLVIYTSDNGPSLAHLEEGGSALPLRGGKFTMFEGGVRVPCVMRWPETIPEGVTSDVMVASLDFFPTIIKLAGEKSSNRDLDGYDISRLLKDPSNETKTPRDEYYYVKDGKMLGVRKGDWKYLSFPTRVQQKVVNELFLFDLKNDPYEENNLIDTHPEKAQELISIIENHPYNLAD